MSAALRKIFGRRVSDHYSDHCSNHDEHPPPVFRLFRQCLAPVGWDSLGVAEVREGSRGGVVP